MSAMSIEMEKYNRETNNQLFNSFKKYEVKDCNGLEDFLDKYYKHERYKGKGEGEGYVTGKMSWMRQREFYNTVYTLSFLYVVIVQKNSG